MLQDHDKDDDLGPWGNRMSTFLFYVSNLAINSTQQECYMWCCLVWQHNSMVSVTYSIALLFVSVKLTNMMQTIYTPWFSRQHLPQVRLKPITACVLIYFLLIILLSTASFCFLLFILGFSVKRPS